MIRFEGPCVTCRKHPFPGPAGAGCVGCEHWRQRLGLQCCYCAEYHLRGSDCNGSLLCCPDYEFYPWDAEASIVTFGQRVRRGGCCTP